MKYLALFVVLLCINQTVSAQAYIAQVDSTIKAKESCRMIDLNLPFIGIVRIEPVSSAFAQATIPFQIPVSKKEIDSLPLTTADTCLSSDCLELKKNIWIGVDSLEADG